ncbi:uncharacterized protein with PQ loop repeat [Kribbella sp. VKM Ac-2568]|nr:uncharacterized protein with PQ loop repeat [Kribbella sp. VKM Ac-2568]
MVVELLAWCGAALSCLLCIPQAARTIREERLDGVSACTYWIILANAAVWAAWSLLTGEHAAGAPALVNGPAAVIILRRLLAARHSPEAGRSPTGFRGRRCGLGLWRWSGRRR